MQRQVRVTSEKHGGDAFLVENWQPLEVGKVYTRNGRFYMMVGADSYDYFSRRRETIFKEIYPTEFKEIKDGR